MAKTIIFSAITMAIMWITAFVLFKLGFVHPAVHVNIGFISGYIVAGIVVWTR